MKEQVWSRTQDGVTDKLYVPVESTGFDREPTGTVTVSIEAFSELLEALGYERES